MSGEITTRNVLSLQQHDFEIRAIFVIVFLVHPSNSDNMNGTNKNNSKMSNMVLGVLIIALGVIIMAIFGAIGTYLIQMDSTNQSKINQEELLEKHDSTTMKVDEIGTGLSTAQEELNVGVRDLEKSHQKTQELITEIAKKAQKRPTFEIKTGDNSPVIIGDKNNVVIQNPRKNPKFFNVVLKPVNRETNRTPFGLEKLPTKAIPFEKIYQTTVNFEIKTDTPFDFYVRPNLRSLVSYMLFSNGGYTQTESAIIPDTKIDALRFMNALSGKYQLMIMTHEPIESFENGIIVHALGSTMFFQVENP